MGISDFIRDNGAFLFIGAIVLIVGFKVAMRVPSIKFAWDGFMLTGGVASKGAGIWTKSKCRAEARKYKTATQFAKHARGAFFTAKENGWLETYTWLKMNNNVHWTKELCEEVARNFDSKPDFAKNANSAYQYAVKNGLLSNFTWLKPREFRSKKTKWTRDVCMKEASKYVAMIDFRTNKPQAYNAMARNGWLKECDWLQRRAVSQIKKKKARQLTLF